MKHTFTCPHCGRTSSTECDVPPGAKTRCPGCQEVFTPVPLPDDDTYAITPPATPIVTPATTYVAVPTTPPVNSPPSQAAPVSTGSNPPASPSPANRARHRVQPSSFQLLLQSFRQQSGDDEPEEDEPWFYRHLWRYGNLLKATVMVVIVFVLALMVTATVRFGDEHPQPIVYMWVFGLIGIVLYRFFALIHAARVLMAVDQARNIRRTRIREEAKP